VLHVRWLLLSLVLISTFAPASSQARALVVYGSAGRMFPLLDVSDAGDDLSAGKAYGGGLGLQLGPTTAVRANVVVSHGNQRGPTLSLTDTGVINTYYGLDLMVGAPSDAGLAPYLFFGGGRLIADPDQPDTETVAHLAGRAGAGVNYVPDNSFFVLFLEASSWVYKSKLFGFDKLQFNAAVLGGLAFAIPY